MNVVIALCGESSVGKTVVAKLVAERLGAPVRHCGEMAKVRAKELGIDFRQFPKDEHEKLDRETQRLAQESQGFFVMEGRFLNQVLEGLANVLTIRLECSDEERLRRSKAKNKESTIDEIRSAKKADSGEKLHISKAGLAANQIVINTDGL